MGEVRQLAPEERITFQQAAERYIHHVEHVMVRKASTVKDYRIITTKHLGPHLHTKTLEKITPDDIVSYIAAKRRAGLAVKTITNHLNFAHGVFRHAVKRGWTTSNPVAATERPRVAHADPDIRFLNREELEALLRAVPRDDVLGPTEYALYTVAAMTGLRQGELVALRWRDIDWPTGIVRVRRTYTRGEWRTPKSRRSTRAVPLADRAARELERHYQRSAYRADDDIVFCHPHTGGPYDASKLRKRFYDAMRAAGMGHRVGRQGGITFHSLRHTFGTRMAAVGVPMRTLQEWMGHRDHTTTLIYADFAPDPSGGAAFAERAFGDPTDQDDASLIRRARHPERTMARFERTYALGAEESGFGLHTDAESGNGPQLRVALAAMSTPSTRGARRRTSKPRRALVAHHRGSPRRPPRHPDAPDANDLYAVRDFTSRSRTRPTAIDLFCGPGGLSLGLERAGFDVLAAADSDEWAVRTHEANLPGLAWCGDLSDTGEFLRMLDVWGIGRVDLVVGGVPCQPFSRAGRSRVQELVQAGERAPHDHRADLWASFVAVVDALRPGAVLVENVPDLPRWDDGAVLIGLYESLRTLGYTVEARIVDGFRFGVPQHRQRLILIGLDGGRRARWPEPSDGLVSLRDAIGDLPPIPRAQRCEILPYDERRQSSEFQRLMRQGLPSQETATIREHVSRDVRADDMEAFRLLDEGQTYVDLPERLRRYRSDIFTDKYRRLCWSELCRSITAHIAKDGYWYIHPDQHRTLSIREAARVQTFPDGFAFAGTSSHRYRQIGNAVPVLLGEVVGHAVRQALERPRRQATNQVGERFRERLLGWHVDNEQAPPPWRAATDPWLVLMGELTLTRMRHKDAERIFATLERLAPDPQSLTSCDDAEETLERLGVGERSRLLLRVARVLVEHFDGSVPGDAMELRSVPGVGDGVCAAVLTFGFGRRQVLLDRTTARIAERLSRHKDTRRFQLRLDLHRMAGATGPDAEFNRALLDLGRDVCRPEVPLCGSCPLRGHCATGKERHRQLDLISETVAA